jgi:hypothetical protein
VRTTIKLADDVFRAYKQRAAARGTTFAQEVEEALRADLQGRHHVAAGEPFEVLVFAGDGTRALIDISARTSRRAGSTWSRLFRSS